MRSTRHHAILAAMIVFTALGSFNGYMGTMFQFERVAIVERCQLWRLFTCHLTHWSGEHWFWDATAFLLAGSLLVRLTPKRLWALLILTPPFISLWILAFNPTVSLYRGLSGVDMAMYVLLALSLSQRFVEKKQWNRVAAAVLLLLALSAKLAYEYFTGNMLFVVGDGKGTLLISAHLAGMLSGVICFFGVGWRRAIERQ